MFFLLSYSLFSQDWKKFLLLGGILYGVIIGAGYKGLETVLTFIPQLERIITYIWVVPIIDFILTNLIHYRQTGEFLWSTPSNPAIKGVVVRRPRVYEIDSDIDSADPSERDDHTKSEAEYNLDLPKPQAHVIVSSDTTPSPIVPERTSAAASESHIPIIESESELSENGEEIVDADWFDERQAPDIVDIYKGA